MTLHLLLFYFYFSAICYASSVRAAARCTIEGVASHGNAQNEYREQLMDAKKLVDLTNDIVQSYYRNDIEPFLNHVDEHVQRYGPDKGQFLSGRQALQSRPVRRNGAPLSPRRSTPPSRKL